MTAYYNEFDPKAAAWLRELIKQGHIAPGIVDERSISDVRPIDLKGFTQCHFFAGIGVWSYALRRSGWADDRPVWTGSCPCQPFSSAGRRGGVDDERHLWPHWHHLISQCQPAIVFGEQVASKDGLGWLDLVSTDMEATGYAFGAADLCAAGVGAPHIRQRLFFGAKRLADADIAVKGMVGAGGIKLGDGETDRDTWIGHRGGSGDGGMADADDKHIVATRNTQRLGDIGGSVPSGGVEHPSGDGRQQWRAEPSGRGASSGCRIVGLADAEYTIGRAVSQHGENGRHGAHGGREETHSVSGTCCEIRGRTSPTNGHWRDADWLYCRDGKWRPVEPGTFPLAHGSAARVGRLRGYGNAIVAQAAQTFIESFMES